MTEEKSSTPKIRMTQERWLKLFTEWQASGESQETFCRSKGINYHTFTYWRNKHNTKQRYQKDASFSKARISGAMATSYNGIRIILTNGAQIVIPASYDRVSLSDFLKIVGVV